ncbi:keratin, type I cytoskeletal 9 [Drosophila busckii]|uniref:keratin, type I cytoskeletal 9 n=1 Tax=Drosophila busckii TaxID=30019 RepID=UPI00083F3C25|nr:keratin, type I cytoskeletal 9 [Drosophila busckii]
MRSFVTLCTLLALAQAKPQGYNYASGVSGTIGGGGGYVSAPSNKHSVSNYGPLGAFQGASVGSLLSGSSHGHGSHYSGGGGATYASAPASSGYSSSGDGSSNYGGSSSAHYGGGGGGGYSQSSGGSSFTGFAPTPNIGFGSLSGYQAPSYQQEQQQEQRASFEAPLIHKQFFTVAAPEEHESLERVKHLVIGRPQRNYRVVFIKAPSSSSANVKLSAEYAPKEEKTVIYVLSKKDSTLEVNDIATPAPTLPSKPEIFFIKYKTDAEAAHAQQQIQAEYDRIEGSSEHTNDGVAGVQSVVGILDAANGGGSIATGGSYGGSTGGSYGGSTGGNYASGSSSHAAGHILANNLT